MSADERQRKQSALKWHAVDVSCTEHACAAARALDNKRFLSRESPPQLPLKDCTMPADCRCRYQHFADRRDGPRRDAETGASGIRRAPDANRRSGRGRRQSD